MVNEFRVLLCNLPYQVLTPQDHLAKGFNGLLLPKELSDFRRILYPDGTSRADALFITHNLVNAVYTTTFRPEIVRNDSRVTYTPDADGAYFSATRIGVPVVSNSFFPLFTYGDYIPYNDVYSEEIQIAQIGSSLAVRVYSGVTGKVYIPSLTLNFGGDNLSQQISLSEIGITIKIGGTNSLFIGSSGKTWKVGIESPRAYDLLAVSNLLKVNVATVNNMLEQPTDEDTTKYEWEWRNNNNAVYRLSALLVCYVSRLRKLLNE